MTADGRDTNHAVNALDAVDKRITPPPNYGNNGEGASAPDRRSGNLRWDCGHLTTKHSRAEAAACRENKRPIPHPSTTPRSAADICTEAARLVGGDREVTHGDKSINFANTAALWNAILAAKAKIAVRGFGAFPLLDALDVTNMLEAFKIARRYSGSHNLDDYIDGAGYAGCAGEIAEKLDRKSP